MQKGVAVRHPVIPVPRSLDEAAKFLSSIGKEQREIGRIKTILNVKVEALEDRAMDNAKSHEEKIDELVEGLFVFAESNRDELTEKGKRKLKEVPTGIFGWRMTPPAVSIRDKEAVIKRLKQLGLERFIRVKETPDKEAMLREQEKAKTVRGISIDQHEEFVVKPSELEVEIASGVNKLKKAAETK